MLRRYANVYSLYIIFPTPEGIKFSNKYMETCGKVIRKFLIKQKLFILMAAKILGKLSFTSPKLENI